MVVKVVAEVGRDATPDPVALACIRRDRSVATQRLERDRDVEAWRTAMRRLDSEEGAATTTMRDAIPAAEAVAYRRNLPETWRQSAGGRGRRMVAETLFSEIRAVGFREMEFELMPHAVALGLAAALPTEGFELRVAGYGRGERHSPATNDLPITMRLAEPPEPCDLVRSA